MSDGSWLPCRSSLRSSQPRKLDEQVCIYKEEAATGEDLRKVKHCETPPKNLCYTTTQHNCMHISFKKVNFYGLPLKCTRIVADGSFIITLFPVILNRITMLKSELYSIKCFTSRNCQYQKRSKCVPITRTG